MELDFSDKLRYNFLVVASIVYNECVERIVVRAGSSSMQRIGYRLPGLF